MDQQTYDSANEVEERQVGRVLMRLEQRIKAMESPCLAEAEHAAMRLNIILDSEKRSLSRLGDSLRWTDVCIRCSAKLADLLTKSTDFGIMCACDGLAALSQVSELSRNAVMNAGNVLDGLLRALVSLESSHKTVAFSTLSTISLHSEQGSYAIVSTGNALNIFVGFLASEDPEIKKEVTDLLNNCAYFSERAARLIAEEEGIIASLVSMCAGTRSDLGQHCLRGSAIGALNSLSMHAAVAPRLASAGAVAVAEMLRELSLPSGSARDFDELRSSAAEAQMLVANLSVHYGVGKALHCSDDVLQSVVHFAGCAVAGQNYDALHGEALWLTKGCLLPLSRLLRCERNLARLVCLESAGGEDGTWRSGHVALSIVGRLLQSWLEQYRREHLGADILKSDNSESEKPDWIRRNLWFSLDEVAIGLAVLDAMVDNDTVDHSQCELKMNCCYKSKECSANWFLEVLRNEDGVTRMCRTEKHAKLDRTEDGVSSLTDENSLISCYDDGKCKDHMSAQRNRSAHHKKSLSREDPEVGGISVGSAAHDRRLPLRELLLAVADEPVMQTHAICSDILENALASSAMRPRLLALTMGHHCRLGAGYAGQRCWLRELDANLLYFIARASCTISVYASALSQLIYTTAADIRIRSLQVVQSSARGEENVLLKQEAATAGGESVDGEFNGYVSPYSQTADLESARPAKRQREVRSKNESVKDTLESIMT